MSMPINITCNEDLTKHILELVKFMENAGVEMKPYPSLVFSKENSHKTNLLGPTAWYEPDTKKVVVITEGRHPKDIMRSIAHEFIHHSQNITGKLQKNEKYKEFDPNYAQNDKHLRAMEEEAYLKGNLIFRDWTDSFNKSKK